MPALHDQSSAYESVTTDGGLTIPMCDYAAGMLMVIILVGDTGTPTVGVTGSPATWNQLFQRVNTCSTTVLWRYATASEPDVVLTASAVETYSGGLFVWRDVYQGYTGGSPPVFSQTTSTGTQIALPTITTSAADSIVMGLVSSAAASSLAFIDSILQELFKVDGAAEGFGAGWFYKRAAGLTTAYNVASLSSQAGTKAVIEIRAPAGGATEFPTYPVSDASILLSPQPGIAWDSNTAMAATADTNFGTSIAGKTCNDATVATVADIGLDVDCFMSFSGLTNAASATAISGAEAVMAAARYNVGDRNILGHFRHPSPIHNQRLSPLKTGRGIWMGMRSGATAGSNWKVWQVHAKDVKIAPGSPQPIVVNAANTDTIATNGTLSNSDVRGYGFWVSGLGALTNQACFGPLWAMDTTVLAGGTSAADPMNSASIVQAAAKNKDRVSAVLQGEGQLLCLQMLQFGNGGTDPLYLDLSYQAIEFPSRKNSAKKVVNYNGTDNLVGHVYYPGSGQTVDLRSAVFSSASRFKWGFHASTPADALVETEGGQVIGGGDVFFAPNVPIVGMSFTDNPTITQNSCAVSASTFVNSKIISATLGDMDNISGCAFTSSATGHAIEVGGSAATITFTGNTFTGYAASNGSTGNEAIYVNIATGTVTINISGGTTPSIRTAGATVVVNNSVSVTIAANVSLVGAEVRIYDLDGAGGTDYGTELEGTESHGSATYAYSGAVANVILIQILQTGYVEFTQQYTMPAANANLGINLIPDINA